MLCDVFAPGAVLRDQGLCLNFLLDMCVGRCTRNRTLPCSRTHQVIRVTALVTFQTGLPRGEDVRMYHKTPPPFSAASGKEAVLCNRWCPWKKTSAGRKGQAGDRVERYRLRCAAVVQSAAGVSALTDHCHDSGSSPRPFSVQAEEMGALAGPRPGWLHAAAIECRFVDGAKARTLYLLDGIDLVR